MAQLERAYALVLAASPDSTTQINFGLQPDNATNTWLYTEAVKDAHARAINATAAAGAKLGAVKVIDPTERACQTDILARTSEGDDDGMVANDVGAFPVVQPRVSAPEADIAPPPPIPVPPVPMAGNDFTVLQAKALQNPFIQTPPLQRLEARACVVYGLD